jgi:hypothetical protein
MAYANMIQECLGAISGTNLGLVKIKLNEAFEAIQNENLFSFQLKTGGWLAPGLLGDHVYPDSHRHEHHHEHNFYPDRPDFDFGIDPGFLSPGTISIEPYSDQMTGDAIATAAWYKAKNPIITVYQIRVPYYDLYNIIAIGGNGTIAYATIFTQGSGQTPGTYTIPVLDNGGPGTGGSVSITVEADGTAREYSEVISAGSGYINPYVVFSEGGTPATFTVTQIAVLTLDRLWTNPRQLHRGYMAYVAYFAAPAGFKEWYYIVDCTNNATMDWWTLNQIDLSEKDPQRTDYSQPEYVVYYGPDIRAGSATYGQQLFELWEGPVTELPYSFGYKGNWPALVSPNDTLPFPLTEELVKLRALEMLSLWKEGSKGDEMERGAGANWQFLAQAYNKEYVNRLKLCKNMDRNIVDLYFTRMRRTQSQQPFASVTGQLNVGS